MQKKMICLFFSLLIFSSLHSQAISSIEEFNEQLPFWGVSWNPGQGSINGYYPSFYTGFAPRSEHPERIHIRTSRGNQTRVSVILDDQTVKDYLFDLAKREQVYRIMTVPPKGKKAAINTNPKDSNLIPQLEYFSNIINSPFYNIQGLVDSAVGDISNSESFYNQSLSVMTSLNPGRLFIINLDLRNEFLKWKQILKSQALGSDPSSVFTVKSEKTVIALDSLVWGRVNYTDTPSAEILAQLVKAANFALVDNDAALIPEAFILFKMLTSNKYNFKIVDANGQWKSALTCNDAECSLNYPELTAIYPTGSVKSFTNDQFGNKIPVFATPGLWPFLDRSYHDVDHIRDEPYYGWAPKLDFEGIGNGFHNPAVRFNGGNFSNSVKDALGSPREHTQYWAVKRGGVSHGCLRLPLGHVWEMRHIMPVENDKMKGVFQFGNNSQDFDLYDVDGNGVSEVMGVEYQISYNTKGNSGLDKREGEELEISNTVKNSFYTTLYGSKNVFDLINSSFVFIDPTISLPSHIDLKTKKTKTTLSVKGEYLLYDQSYEKDKVQFYLPVTTSGLTSKGSSPLSKRIVRLMGRIRGCSPTTDKSACGEQAFDTEFNSILKELY